MPEDPYKIAFWEHEYQTYVWTGDPTRKREFRNDAPRFKALPHGEWVREDLFDNDDSKEASE